MWVICDDVKINFPVPYLNNYLPISLRQKKAFEYFVSVLREYTQGLKTTFPNEHAVVECPYKEDCKGIYNLNMIVKAGGKIVCPQCLRTMVFSKGHIIKVEA